MAPECADFSCSISRANGTRFSTAAICCVPIGQRLGARYTARRCALSEEIEDISRSWLRIIGEIRELRRARMRSRAEAHKVVMLARKTSS